MSPTDQRITELEIRLAYQEDTLTALDKVIAAHAEQIARLEQVVKALNRRLGDVMNELESGPLHADSKPPPHY